MAGARKKRGRRRTPRQSRSRALVDAVVEATLDLFAKRDEDSPSVRAIAERAGVGVGSIYEYFSSREGVIDAVVERFTAENFDRFASRLERESSSLDTLVGELLDEVVDVYTARPSLTRSAIGVIVTFGRLGPMTKKRDQIATRIADRIGARFDRVPQDQVRRSVRGVTDMAMGILVSQLYREEASIDAETRAVLERMLMAELEHLRRMQDGEHG